LAGAVALPRVAGKATDAVAIDAPTGT